MTEQQKLTRLGKEIIPVSLIGQNAAYRVLKTPAKPAYPKGNEIRYSDDYLSQLNSVYTLNDILGEHVQAIAEGRNIERFIMGSPLRNTEGEDVLAHMLLRSVRAGEWQPFVIDVPYLTDTSIDTAKEYLKRVESISPSYNVGKIEGGILFGISVAKRGGFALPVEHDNKVVIIPSQAYLEYAAQQK
ncbi:hypothetical protein KA107_01230 [Candidatus Pacearchaeota archaeon]|nr:hypothetical protein [Candidatus Pacearchaeota archaeon]